jgi:hypothetical protein
MPFRGTAGTHPFAALHIEIPKFGQGLCAEKLPAL